MIELAGGLLILVPALIGVFWGAPLVARELETGTYKMVWNQSVTRTSWLAVKLGLLGLATVMIMAMLSIALTWAAGPYDDLIGTRFTARMFAARNVAPLGYAIFALVLGTTMGLLIRRSLPAMATTLAIFIAIQVAVPMAIRPHLMSPVTETVPFAAPMLGVDDFFLHVRPESVVVGGYQSPGAWVLSSSTHLLNEAGERVGPDQIEACLTGSMSRDLECLAEQDLHFTVSYHPADRYWTFQWIELGGFAVLTGLLTAFGFWRVNRELT
jgi:ABC-type transport system involved in multi-copper enzyme maturation permease subunit